MPMDLAPGARPGSEAQYPRRLNPRPDAERTPCARTCGGRRRSNSFPRCGPARSGGRPGSGAARTSAVGADPAPASARCRPAGIHGNERIAWTSGSRFEGPRFEIRVWTGSIAIFDRRQPRRVVGGQGPFLRTLEHRSESIKGLDMLFDPGLGIVLRGDRRDEEGPVRRLQEEKFAGELRHDSTDRRILLGSSGTQGVDERVFRSVHFLPNPSGTVVQPDIVMASLAPRSFRNLDGRAGRMRREKIRGSDRVDVSLQFSQNRFQPRWALEPPVAKEFRVERRDDDAGSARGLLMLMESLEDQRCKMVRMGGGSLLRGVGVVGDLLSQGELPVRDTPVPQAVHPMFAMKLEVGAVPRISVVRTPDLDAGPRVPRKNRDFPMAGRGERVRLIRRKARSVPSRIETTLFETVLVSADRRAPGDEVRIHEEESDPVTNQQLLEPGTEPGSCRACGTGPDVTRAVGALRKPDPAGTSPEASAVARDAGGELRVDRFIATEERQVSMGGSRHDDLDPIAVLQPRERREQILIVCLHEVGLCATVEVGPGRGSPPTTVIPRRVELPLIRLRSIRPLLQVGQESVAEPRRGKHLGEDRRNANRDRSFAAFLLEAIKEPEDREIALGRGLVEPRFPMRPTTMAEDPR